MSGPAHGAPRSRTPRPEAGQAAVEYIGMLLVVVAVIALVAASDVAARVTDVIDTAICQVSHDNDADCDTAGGTRAGGDAEQRRRGLDSDGDGLSDREERRRGTLPGKADSDDDGLLDPRARSSTYWRC